MGPQIKEDHKYRVARHQFWLKIEAVADAQDIIGDKTLKNHGLQVENNPLTQGISS